MHTLYISIVYTLLVYLELLELFSNFIKICIYYKIM